MNKYLPMMVTALVIVVVYATIALLKKKMAKELTEAMFSNSKRYKELLYSKKALLLLDSQVVIILRAQDQFASGNLEEAKAQLKCVELKRLNPQDLKNVMQLRSVIAIETKNKQEHQKIADDLRKLKNEKNADWINPMIKKNHINEMLYFDFDVKVISELRQMIDEAGVESRSILMMSLAKAFHMNHQFKEAKNTLLAAKETADEETAKMIDAIINDQSLLDK